jgi:DNA-directed RNA polymerase subunit RPC12/RpoP
VNDCDNCIHDFSNNDERCALCRAAGDGQYPGWEAGATDDVPATTIETMPEYLHRVGEPVKQYLVDQYLCTSCGLITERIENLDKTLAIPCSKCAHRADLLRKDGTKAMNPVAQEVPNMFVPVTVDGFELEQLRAEVERLENVRMIVGEYRDGGFFPCSMADTISRVWDAVKT